MLSALIGRLTQKNPGPQPNAWNTVLQHVQNIGDLEYVPIISIMEKYGGPLLLQPALRPNWRFLWQCNARTASARGHVSV